MSLKVNQELTPLIEQLLPLDQDDLCVFLGTHEFQSELGASSISPSELIKKVKKWISSHATEIRIKVCNDEIVKQEILHGNLEKKLLAGHIAALLTGLGHTEITIAAIAVYYINFGYKEICNDKYNQ